MVRDPLPDDDVREIRRVKVRVEQERIPPGEDPQFHLKLGKGALTDVEFTVQLLQLAARRATQPDVRAPGNHRRARAGWSAPACSTPTTASVLEESYRFCERARNARYLVTGAPGDALPGGVDDLRIGRLLGFVEEPAGRAPRRVPPRHAPRRARVVDRVFYGRTDL